MYAAIPQVVARITGSVGGVLVDEERRRSKFADGGWRAGQRQLRHYLPGHGRERRRRVLSPVARQKCGGCGLALPVPMSASAARTALVNGEDQLVDTKHLMRETGYRKGLRTLLSVSAASWLSRVQACVSLVLAREPVESPRLHKVFSPKYSYEI